VGKETTYGTGVAATRIVYASGAPTLTRTRAARPRQLATGNRYNQRAFTLGPSEVGGSVVIPMSASEMLEWLAITLQGNVSATTPTGATNGRLYSYTGGGTALDSMTLQYDDGARAHRGLGVYGDSMTLAGNANGEATATFALFGVERELNALTGSLSSRVPTITEGYETLVMLDAFGATPGVNQIPSFLQAWSIVYSNGLQRKYLANNRNRMDRAVIAPMSLKATLTVEASTTQAATELAAWDATTKRLVSLRFGFNAINAISGDTAVNEVQTLTKGGTWSAGTYVLTVLGQATSAIAYDAIAATIQTAINTALAALGTGYTAAVTGGPLGTTPIVVTFSGSEVAGRNVPMIVADVSLVTGSSPTVAVVQTTPGYEAAEGITLTMPGFWEAVDIGQTDAGTRVYQLALDYLYDPTNAVAFALTAQCGRAAAWS
jgi:hypothetical protein